MHIFDIHTNIQQNKGVFTQKLSGGTNRTNDSNKGAKLQQKKLEQYILPQHLRDAHK
jgi:hypothetical protein